MGHLRLDAMPLRGDATTLPGGRRRRLPASGKAGVPTRQSSSWPAARSSVVWDDLRSALDELARQRGRELAVIDAGGGTGGFAVPLAQLGHRIIVVDPSPDSLASLERRAAEAGVGELVSARQGDLDTLGDAVGERGRRPALPRRPGELPTTPRPGWRPAWLRCSRVACSACWRPTGRRPSSDGCWPAASMRLSGCFDSERPGHPGPTGRSAPVRPG